MEQNELKLLTLNIGELEISLPYIGSFPLIIKKGARFRKFHSYIEKENYDVIMLQEISQTTRTRLIKKLHHRYPYAAFDTSRKLFRGDLLILSRFPITEQKFVPYRANTLFERIPITKGVLKATIEVSGRTITLFNTHLTSVGLTQSGTTARVERIRSEQIRDVLQFLHKQEHPVILAGDMNAGPETSPDNYEQLVSTFVDMFEFCDIPHEGHITWTPTNPYTQKIYMSSPDQQVDGFYIQAKDIVRLNADFYVEVVLKNPVVSDHYGVHMGITFN